MKANSIRTSIAVVTCLIILVMVIVALDMYVHCGQGIQRVDLSDIAKQKSIEEYFAYTKFYATLALAIIGALWALLFSEKGKTKTFDWVIIVLIMNVIAGFAATMICHFNHSETIITRGFEVGAIELSAPVVRFWFNWQRYFFYYELTLFLLTAYFLYKHRKG